MLTTGQRAAWLSAAYYFATFAALGAHLPYWPVWLETWGLSSGEVGFYLGAATVARILGTTLLPMLGDLYGIRRLLIVVTALATVLVHLAHLVVETEGVLMGLTLVAAVVMAPATPMGEALGLRAAERFGFQYAPVRAAGSIGFIAANVGVGAVMGSLGPNAALWTVVAGFTGVAILGALHPGGGAAPGADADRVRLAETPLLLGLPVFLVFALASAFHQASHMVYYIYSVLDWRAQGISDAVIGWLWAVGVIAEVVLMLGPGRHWVARIGPSHALALAAMAGLIRWVALTASPEQIWLWPLQALHALSFGLGHLAAMAFLAAAIPGRLLGTAHGVKSGILGGGLNALVLFIAGWVVASADIATAYWLAAGLSALAIGLALALNRIWDGGRVVRA